MQVARNALEIAARDMAIDPDDAALVAHLHVCALDALAIDRPKYLHELGESPPTL